MHVSPQNLRRLRKERGLSRRELAEKSNVSQKQIQRLEDPKQASESARLHTVSCLARALKVDIKKLMGRPQEPGFKLTRIRASLSPGVRVAYDLIEQRYGIGTGHLINMAPLFFALLAEGSLAWRQAQLKELDEAIDRLAALGDDRRRCAWHAVHASDDSSYEKEAIDRGDLFADPYPNDYRFEPNEEWEGSPFADYLRELADKIGKPGAVDVGCYGPESVSGFAGLPSYSVCREDLAKVAPITSGAIHALRAGDVRLAEIPEALMAEYSTEEREAWLEEQLSPQSKEYLAEVADIAKWLGLNSSTDGGLDPESGSRAGADA